MSVETSKTDTSASEIKAKKKYKKVSKEENNDSNAAKEEGKAEKKTEKKKSKKISKDEDDTSNAVNDEEKTEKKTKSKKSKKRQRDDDEEEHNADEKKAEDNKLNNQDETEEAEKANKKKRKSVSFSDKVDAREIENNEGGDDNNGDDAEDEGDDEHKRKKRKQEKRAKREQRRKKDTTTAAKTTESTTSSNDNSILAYLSQYYHDRASWKFQKIREAQLLKNVFSLEQVPSEQNPALLAYLKGLKSEGARTRLRKSAQDIIKFDERKTGGEDGAAEETNYIAKLPALPESWRERYDNAVYRFKGNLNAGVKDLNEGLSLAGPDDEDVDADVLTRFEHRKRAELVSWTVSGKISKSSTGAAGKQEKDTEMEDTSAAAKGSKQKAPARKKRKNRTMIVEISSSSESDSDSD